NLTLGAHTIKAVYTSNNPQLSGSSGTLPGGEMVRANVSVGVASSASESSYGQGVTFTATVSPPTSGLLAPGGTGQFALDGPPFGGPVTGAVGQAVSPSLSAMAAGAHTITAMYAGDPIYLANSGSTSQTVDKVHLTVTATARSMIYGSAIPNLTY